jgi:hypothetical protein
VERWRKWSFGLSPALGGLENLLAPDPSWIAVHKERKLRLYDLAAGGRTAAASSGQVPAHGCAVELTRIAVAEEAWWSVGFEAYGSTANFRKDLLPIVEHVLAQGLAHFLDTRASCGYPAWLAALPR